MRYKIRHWDNFPVPSGRTLSNRIQKKKVSRYDYGIPMTNLLKRRIEISDRSRHIYVEHQQKTTSRHSVRIETIQKTFFFY